MKDDSYPSRPYDRRPSRGGRGRGDGFRRRLPNREFAAVEAAKRSQQNCRVYVGNLAFSVKWYMLKDYMKEAGDVVYAEVLTLPDGMSKGCGVVEYSKPEDAQNAIKILNNTVFEARPIFVREDREKDARYGDAAVSGRGAYGANPSIGGSHGIGLPQKGAFAPSNNGATQLFVSGLNDTVGWRDLKDLFSRAGDVIRADVDVDENGKTKGTGTVIYSDPAAAALAIQEWNGKSINGMTLEVVEDDGEKSFGRKGGVARSGKFENADPSEQIFVKNLPWSTSNEDLVELFQTIGDVKHAEVVHENGRSKGVGIVQFDNTKQAESAIAKFQGYIYGGRPLHLSFNVHWRDFDGTGAPSTESPAKAEEDAIIAE